MKISKDKIESYFFNKIGFKPGILLSKEEVNLLVYIIEKESSFETNAIRVNKNGTCDVGLCQFNSYWYWIKEKIIHPTDALDWEKSIDIFCKMYFQNRLGDWEAFRVLRRQGWENLSKGGEFIKLGISKILWERLTFSL